MRQRLKSLRGEDRARLVSYCLASIWPIMFLLVQPPSYSIISDIILHVWMVVGAIGGIGAIVGVLTGIDLKVELPSIYLILLGPTLYLAAQIGFAFAGQFQMRFALIGFVLWHISLMFPRIVGLESFRRRERIRQGARR